jgi:hypothetical protein
MGLVWGWLIGSYDYRTSTRARNLAIIFLVTLALAAGVFIFAGWRGSALFLGATLLTLLLHLGWLNELRLRFDPPPNR